VVENVLMCVVLLFCKLFLDVVQNAKFVRGESICI